MHELAAPNLVESFCETPFAHHALSASYRSRFAAPHAQRSALEVWVNNALLGRNISKIYLFASTKWRYTFQFLNFDSVAIGNDIDTWWEEPTSYVRDRKIATNCLPTNTWGCKSHRLDHFTTTILGRMTFNQVH